MFFDDLRVVHSEGPVVQRDDYYPFGLTFGSYSRAMAKGNSFLYQGKERQDVLGLNSTDFGWRMYDPAAGRTWQPDPHADRYTDLSPYSWAGNDPIATIDPDGRDIKETSRGLLLTGQDAQMFYRALSYAFVQDGCKCDCPGKPPCEEQRALVENELLTRNDGQDFVMRA